MFFVIRTEHARAFETLTFNVVRLTMYQLWRVNDSTTCTWRTVLARKVSCAITLPYVPYHDVATVDRLNSMEKWLRATITLQPIPIYIHTYMHSTTHLMCVQVLILMQILLIRINYFAPYLIKWLGKWCQFGIRERSFRCIELKRNE